MAKLVADFGVLNTAQIPGLVFYNYDMPLPEAKKDAINIPGQDGTLDLTGAYGRVSYQNRDVTLFMYDKSPYGAQRSTNRSRLASLLNGKELPLVISDDPTHRIKGRWYVDITSEEYSRTKYSIRGDCYPFRTRGLLIYRLNAAGGVDIVLQGGDKETRPTFEVNHDAVIEFEGKTYSLKPGAWFIEDLYLKPGLNYLHIDTLPDGGNVTWQELNDEGITWGEFATKRLSEWRWGDEPPQVRDTWESLREKEVTWQEFASKPLIEWQYPADQDVDTYTVFISYEREDF